MADRLIESDEVPQLAWNDDQVFLSRDFWELDKYPTWVDITPSIPTGYKIMLCIYNLQNKQIAVYFAPKE